MIIRKEANNSGRNLKGKQGHKAGHLRMVVIGNLEADTVKETVDDVCEKESTEFITTEKKLLTRVKAGDEAGHIRNTHRIWQ